MNLDQFLNQRNRFYFFLLMFATFLLYAQSINFSFFVYDDLLYIKENFRVTNVNAANLLWFWSDANTKTPLFFNFVQLATSIWGNHAAPALRILNIFFHGLNAGLVFLFVKQFLLMYQRAYSVEHLRPTGIVGASLFAAVIFILHPVQVESVVWVYSMRGVLASSFALSTLILYLYFSDSGRKEFFYVAISLYLMGMFFKFSVVTVPVMFIIIDYFLNKELNFIGCLVKNWVILSIGFCFYFIFSFEWVSSYVASVKVTTADSFYIALRTSVFYLKRLLLPDLYLFDAGLNFKSFKNLMPNVWQNRLYHLVMILLILLSVRQLITNTKNIFVLCFLSFLVLIFPGLGVITHDFQFSSFVADRYMYLSVIAFALALVCSWITFAPRYPRVLTGLLGVLTLFLFYKNVTLTREWKEPGELLLKTYTINQASEIAFDGILTHFDQKNELDKVDVILWQGTIKAVKNRQSFIRFVKFLGRRQQVAEGLVALEAWKYRGAEYINLLYFYLYLEAGLYSFAEREFANVLKMPTQAKKDWQVDELKLRRQLNELKAQQSINFSVWKQTTQEVNPKLADKLRLEASKRSLNID